MDVTDQRVLKARAEEEIRNVGYAVCLCGELFLEVVSYLRHRPKCAIVERAAR